MPEDGKFNSYRALVFVGPIHSKIPSSNCDAGELNEQIQARPNL